MKKANNKNEERKKENNHVSCVNACNQKTRQQ